MITCKGTNGQTNKQTNKQTIIYSTFWDKLSLQRSSYMCTSEEFFFRILIPAYVARNICHEHLPRNNSQNERTRSYV
jgi:hypothetical protein